jgi:hypothetical protein
VGKQEMREQLTALNFTEKARLLERLRDRTLALASAGVEMVFDYAGDDQPRIMAWFRERLRSIGTCLSTEHPEAVLTLVYSAIDVMGWLAAPSDKKRVSKETFVGWCNKYVVDRLQSVDGLLISGDDLWSARCGFLHTSTPVSEGRDSGQSHEIWYRFRGKDGAQDGVDLFPNASQQSLGLDVETLALAFREGGKAFIGDLNADHDARQVADSRAQHFLRWGLQK